MMNSHPLADLFPLMEGEPFKELCESVKNNGLVHPIIRDGGLIIDGRNRQRACEKTGRAPHYREFRDLKLNTSVEDYIWIANGPRRNMSDGQKATIQISYKEMVEKFRAEGKDAMSAGGGDRKSAKAKESGLVNSPNPIPPVHTRKKLAEQAGVPEFKIQQAEVIHKYTPELESGVMAGTIPISEAFAKAKHVRNGHKTKRQGQLENAQKQRMMTALQMIRGSLMSLEKLDLVQAKTACSEDEVHDINVMLSDLSKSMRKVSKEWSGETNGS